MVTVGLIFANYRYEVNLLAIVCGKGRPATGLTELRAEREPFKILCAYDIDTIDDTS